MIDGYLTLISWPMPSSPAPDTQARKYALPLLALGTTGFAAVWMLLALTLDRTCSWLAPLAALDMVLLLRLSRWPAGVSRSAWSAAATATVIVLANGLIAGGQMGKSLGMRPWEAVLRIGPDFAWLLAQMANTHVDGLFYAASVLLAAWWGLRWGLRWRLNGRHPAPSTH